jgi:hypothetical protein
MCGRTKPLDRSSVSSQVSVPSTVRSRYIHDKKQPGRPCEAHFIMELFTPLCTSDEQVNVVAPDANDPNWLFLRHNSLAFLLIPQFSLHMASISRGDFPREPGPHKGGHYILENHTAKNVEPWPPQGKPLHFPSREPPICSGLPCGGRGSVWARFHPKLLTNPVNSAI